MSRIGHIIKREYLENVRTKAFLIGLILTPVWMGLIFIVPALAKSPTERTERVVIVDATGVLAEDLETKLGMHEQLNLEIENVDADGAWKRGPGGESEIDRLLQSAGSGELFAIILTPPLLEKRAPKGDEQPSRVAGASTIGAMRVGQVLQASVNELIDERIIETRNIPAEDASLLLRPGIRFTPQTRGGQEGSAAQVITPFIFMMLLFMGIVGVSQMLISSTLEEKSNRVYEVLLSSVSPFQLMAGKILGICAVGFTLMLLWSGGGLVAALVQGLDDLVTTSQVGWFLVYYLLGFLMIASLMVAVGSACNTLKEAQNLMAPISLFLALPLMLSFVIMNDPNGSLATVSSLIPPFTPFVMMARIASVPGPPPWQMWASLGVLLIGTYVAIRIAARVFRVGILLYGQPPTLRQIWRWMWTRD